MQWYKGTAKEFEITKMMILKKKQRNKCVCKNRINC